MEHYDKERASIHLTPKERFSMMGFYGPEYEGYKCKKCRYVQGGLVLRSMWATSGKKKAHRGKSRKQAEKFHGMKNVFTMADRVTRMAGRAKLRF
jgi:hypothetical protein